MPMLRSCYRRLVWRGLRRRLAALSLLVLDVDGVLTDGGLWYGPDGELIKRFDVRDGLGIRLLQHAGIEVALLSGGRGGATEVRAQHLGIRHCLVGAEDKTAALGRLQEQLGVLPERMAYLGDDLNDLALHHHVGLLVATSDASKPLRMKADAVLLRSGGHGAVREFAERVLRARGDWSVLSRNGWRGQNA